MKAIYQKGKILSGSKANSVNSAWRKARKILTEKWGMDRFSANEYMKNHGFYCE